MARPLSSNFCYMQTTSNTKTMTDEPKQELLFMYFDT